MSWINTLFELFSGLFSFAVAHFVNIIGLFIASGLIGGLIYFLKSMLFMKWSREDE